MKLADLTLAAVALHRKVFKDITLPDGTFIPAGTLIGAASYSTHVDDALYTGADTFDPFRFARMREGEGESMKHQYVNTSPDYISFGHGRHAWYAACVCFAGLTIFVLTFKSSAQAGSLRPTNSRPSSPSLLSTMISSSPRVARARTTSIGRSMSFQIALRSFSSASVNLPCEQRQCPQGGTP